MSVWTQLFVGERPVDQPEQVNVEGDISQFKKAVKLAWPNNLQHVDASAIRVYASEDEKREHPLSNRAIVTAKFTSLVAVAPAPLSRTVEDITTELEQLKQQIAADERELIEKKCPAEKRLELLREPYARRNFLENELKAELDRVHKNAAGSNAQAAFEAKSVPAGLPSLGRQIGSISGDSLNLGHVPVSSIATKPFTTLAMFQSLKLQDVWTALFQSKCKSYATESDIQGLVRDVLEDVKGLASNKLPEMNLELFNALSVFQLRADIWVVTAAGVPSGVIKVQKPPLGNADPADALNDMVLGGEVFDYLLRLKSFHGLRHCFGIATNYVSWRIFWLPSDETDKIAAADKIEFASRSDHAFKFTPGPVVDADAADMDADDQQIDSSPVSDRSVNASSVYSIRNQAQNEALPGLLASVLAKMNASPHDDVNEIDLNRPYIVLDEKSWRWERIKWRSGLQLNRSRFPTASRLILLQDLGFGKDGRVWKACSASGLCCVLKFSHRLDANAPPDGRTPLQRLEKELAHYSQTGEEARVVVLGGNPALLLSFFVPLDFTVPEYRELARVALRNVIVHHMCVPTDRQRNHLMFSPSRQLAVIIDRADWRPLGQDESAEKELEEHLKALHLNVLDLPVDSASPA